MDAETKENAISALNSEVNGSINFGLVDDSGIIFSEWATLAQDRAGWLKLVTKVPFDIGKPQLRPPRCDTRVTPEEKRRFLARRAQETEQRRDIFNADTDAEET